MSNQTLVKEHLPETADKQRLKTGPVIGPQFDPSRKLRSERLSLNMEGPQGNAQGDPLPYKAPLTGMFADVRLLPSRPDELTTDPLGGDRAGRLWAAPAEACIVSTS